MSIVVCGFTIALFVLEERFAAKASLKEAWFFLARAHRLPVTESLRFRLVGDETQWF
jgi:hypothetical protein